jgi:hypothetical protein
MSGAIVPVLQAAFLPSLGCCSLSEIAGIFGAQPLPRNFCRKNAKTHPA